MKILNFLLQVEQEFISIFQLHNKKNTQFLNQVNSKDLDLVFAVICVNTNARFAGRNFKVR